MGMKYVTVARNRVNRKAVIDDPDKRGAPQPGDDIVQRTPLATLEVKSVNRPPGAASKIIYSEKIGRRTLTIRQADWSA